AGKSTQSRLLCQRLETFGIDALVTREPGGSSGAEEIRALLVSGQVDRWDPLTEALLHFAARHDHVQRTILPALERGVWVITDRFSDSTLAYQGYGQGVDFEKLNRIGEFVVGAAMPDLTLILDLPVAEGFARTELRADGVSRYEQMDRAMHERMRQGFLRIAKTKPARCRMIDAALDTESVHQAVWHSVQERFKIEPK
ncbi:MAG: dTMP kinase, partial [Alphaproteobacteria bacterium]